MTRTPFAVALLAVAAFATAAPVPKVKKAAPHPVTVGTKWEYTRSGTAEVWVEEVTESDTADGVTTFKVRTTAGGVEMDLQTYELRDGVLSVTAHSAGGYTAPRLIWPTGAAAGTVTDNAWAARTPAGVIERVETLTVGEPAEITTPAGTFQATPITRTAKGFNEGTVLWYADGVGLVRHTEPGRAEPILELKSFTPGKK